MLERFRDGDDTAAAIEAALGIPADEFDRRFAEHIDTVFGAVLANFEPWREAQQGIGPAVEAGDWERVAEAAGAAVALMPHYVEDGSPYLWLARALREAGDRDQAKETLRTYWEFGGYSPEALMQLSDWLTEDGETDTAIEVLEDTVLVSPLDESVHAELGDLLLETRPADALREFQALAALEPYNEASVNLRIARAHLALDDTDKATEYLLYALEIAPQYREAQQLLLEIIR
jgi:tetratricopeptide (TPR) repeat protein